MSNINAGATFRVNRNISISNLELDPENPRISENAQGGNQNELLEELYLGFNLNEIALSISKNGYFAEEPLVAIPNKLPDSLQDIKTQEQITEFNNFINLDSTTFTVLEGNRRLSTCKLLLDINAQKELKVRNWPKVSNEVKKTIEELPVIVYPLRKDVNSYLGVRHIIGVAKWGAYAKARYIASLAKSGKGIKEIQDEIGDRKNSARKTYMCHQLLEQAKDNFNYNTSKAEAGFSLLLLATGQGGIKRFLGIPMKLEDVNYEAPIETQNIKKLKELLLWIYGDSNIQPVIKESRDITNKLSYVLDSEEATDYLRKTEILDEAYDRSAGEERMLIKALADINRKLELALGIIHKHSNDYIFDQIKNCKASSDELYSRIESKL